MTTQARAIQQQPPGRSPVGGWLVGAVLGASVLALSLTVARVMYVQGSSMAPTLYPGQSLLIDTLFLFGSPHRGDLVVFRSPVNGETNVKRIIGVPGDLVLVDAGRVLVNTTPLDEPYVHFHDDYSFPPDGAPRRVPEGAYFVLGDNRAASNDSHQGWFVPADTLVGQAMPLPFPPVATASSKPGGT